MSNISRRFVGSGLSSRPGSRFLFSGGGILLPFSAGSFTNATTRHMMIKNPGTGLWEMAGPFAGGTLATKVVGGKRYGQFHSAKSTGNTYSEVLRAAISDWVNTRVNVTDNAENSPLGDLTTDRIYDDSSAATTHYCRQTISYTATKPYILSVVVKPDDYDRYRLYLHADAFGVTVSCDFNLTLVSAYDASNCDYYGILELNDGWYYIYIIATATVTVEASTLLLSLDNDGNATYDGDGSSGLYVDFANVIEASMLSPYIYAAATPATMDKDQFAWSEATVNANSWIRDGFKFDLIMSHATDEMLADDGNEHLIAAYDTTGAKGVVELYFDGADKKIKLRDDDNGALLESAALDWSLGDQIHGELTLDDGSNSKLVVDGGGVDTSYTGTQTAAADGPLHYGMDDSQALQFDLGQISEPEPL